MIVQDGIAHQTAGKSHNIKLEIMTEYLLSQDDDNDIIVDNRLSLGHLSIDDIEGVYFIKFSILQILKIPNDLTTIVFHGTT